MTLKDRRRFIAMGLAAAGGVVAGHAAAESSCGNTAATGAPQPSTVATGASQSNAAEPVASRPTYLVVYRRGPRWVAGKPMAEQANMREHFAYYVDLYRKGHLRSGGGFIDDSGGAAILEAADDAAAAAIIARDPAVVGEVFVPELKQWRQNPWADISKARAGRGI